MQLRVWTGPAGMSAAVRHQIERMVDGLRPVPADLSELESKEQMVCRALGNTFHCRDD